MWPNPSNSPWNSELGQRKDQSRFEWLFQKYKSFSEFEYKKHMYLWGVEYVSIYGEKKKKPMLTEKTKEFLKQNKWNEVDEQEIRKLRCWNS